MEKVTQLVHLGLWDILRVHHLKALRAPTPPTMDPAESSGTQFHCCEFGMSFQTLEPQLRTCISRADLLPATIYTGESLR